MGRPPCRWGTQLSQFSTTGRLPSAQPCDQHKTHQPSLSLQGASATQENHGKHTNDFIYSLLTHSPLRVPSFIVQQCGVGQSQR